MGFVMIGRKGRVPAAKFARRFRRQRRQGPRLTTDVARIQRLMAGDSLMPFGVRPALSGGPLILTGDRPKVPGPEALPGHQTVAIRGPRFGVVGDGTGGQRLGPGVPGGLGSGGGQFQVPGGGDVP